MPYVQRDTNGNIIGCYMPMQPGVAEEWLDEDSPELVFQTKSERIAKLQSAYDIDREKLNKAWLSALIADGAGEVSRQEILKVQMSGLEAQLEEDILTIIMEE